MEAEWLQRLQDLGFLPVEGRGRQRDGLVKCPVCAYPMQIVAGIGTVCEHCNRPYHPGHNYEDLSERTWTRWREGGEEIGY